MLDRKKINCSEAKKIPIVEFLASLGYHPVVTKNNDSYYLSPLRTETKPSFRVNRILNLYYDYGINEGGTIIDLGIKLLNCPIEKLLEKLSNFHFSPVPQTHVFSDTSIRIKETKKLSHPALLSYIQERAIKQDIALKHCTEVHFEMNNKPYFAVGFENKSHGYELRNKFFKGSASPKDITLIQNQSDKLCLFEGFFDFLSYFGSKLEMPGIFDFMILNSIAFLTTNSSIIQQYKEVYLFLDNDMAGRSGSSKVNEFGNKFCIDKSNEYKDFKDLNEYKISERKIAAKEVTLPVDKGIRIRM